MAESDWDAYWRNAKSASEHKDGGPKDEMLERFWFQLFEQVFSTIQNQLNMLDIACGYGAVTHIAQTARRSLYNDAGLQITGVDTSVAALQEVRNRHPDTQCVAANGALLPFNNGSFDIVASQFGIEYAGPPAITEAARMVKPGGRIATVLHMLDGGIYKECALNLDAINGIRHSKILKNFAGIFSSAQAIQHGNGTKEQFRQADASFAESVIAVENVLKRWGQGIADGMLFRLYNDIAHMYQRFKGYDPTEVYDWINLMTDELNTFAGRMSSMLDAALDKQGRDQVIADLTAVSFTIRSNEILSMGKAQIPSAWVIVAEKKVD